MRSGDAAVEGSWRGTSRPAAIAGRRGFGPTTRGLDWAGVVTWHGLRVSALARG